MVIWMWCLSPMDDRDGGPLREDVSLFRFPTARIYIVCVLASRLLFSVRMFSGFGILVAPRSLTFWVTLGGYFSFHFFIPREEVLFNISYILVVSSNCRMLTHICPLLQ